MIVDLPSLLAAPTVGASVEDTGRTYTVLATWEVPAFPGRTGTRYVTLCRGECRGKVGWYVFDPLLVAWKTTRREATALAEAHVRRESRRLGVAVAS